MFITQFVLDGRLTPIGNSRFRPGTLATNRGNDLLIKLLKFRFPCIIDSGTVPVLRQWLNAEASEREQLIKTHDASSSSCVQKLREYMDEHSNSFPLFEFGSNWTEKKKCQMALFLVRLLHDTLAAFGNFLK